VKHLTQFEFLDSNALDSSVEHIHLGDLLHDEHADDLRSVVAEVVNTAIHEEPTIVVIDSAKMRSRRRRRVRPSCRPPANPSGGPVSV
jgi:hypothetical protein